MVDLMKRLGAMMLKRSHPQSRSLARFAIAAIAVLILAAPSVPYASRPPRQVAMFANLGDTGKIVALRIGQQLVVKLPMRDFSDNSWHITKISPSLKLLAGPDEMRPLHWSPWTLSYQIFYFQRKSPGTSELVLEPNYFSKPMILKVID
jgi:hypothetical protein